ncbi:MAG: MarR family winged helix-turn-helix transcriptional regulator, partial [Anaerolineae bacterium]
MNADDLHKRFGHLGYSPGDVLMRDMGFAYWALVKAAERHVGLPRARARLLGHVAMAGEVSQADLQKQLGIDGAAITRQVKLLEAEGLVARRPDPADNRVTLVVVTPAGADRLADVMTKARAFMETCLIGIDAEDIATVVRVLGRMRENVAGL